MLGLEETELMEQRGESIKIRIMDILREIKQNSMLIKHTHKNRLF